MLFKRFGEKLKSLFGGRKIDEEFFDELEDTLIEGDLGARLTDEIITELRETARREKITEAGDLQSAAWKAQCLHDSRCQWSGKDHYDCKDG